MSLLETEQNDIFLHKYLKYKTKYNTLKKQRGGVDIIKVDPISVDEIMKIIETNPTIVDLSNKTINDEGVRAIIPTLGKMTSLNLSNTMKSYDNLMELANALRTNSTLVELNLSNNEITAKGFNTLILALNQSKNTALKTLDLSNNFIGFDTVTIWAKPLGENKTLTTLNLSNNLIKLRAGFGVGDALKLNTTLKHLIIHDNWISDKGVMTWANTGIITIDLSKNNISTPGATALISSIKTLTTLNLSRNNVLFKGQNTKPLREAIEENKTITTLDLSNNNINQKGMDVLVKSLKKNKTITTLNVLSDNDPIGLSGQTIIDAAIIKK